MMFNPDENFAEDVETYMDEEEFVSEQVSAHVAGDVKEIDLVVKTTFLSRHPLKNVRMSVEAPSLAEPVMKNKGNWDWVFRTHGQVRNNRKVCDPNWFSGPECDSVLADIDTICSRDPMCGHERSARNGIVMATNAPIVTAINKFPITEVLVCGMDHQGADLKRLQIGSQHHNIENVIVDVIDWHAGRTRHDWPDLPGISIRCVVSDASALLDTLRGLGVQPRYEMIMMNHSFPSFMHHNFDLIMRIMEKTRAGGVKTKLVGTYWDPHTMVVSNYCGYDPITRSFSFDGQVRLEGVTYNKFTMLGKMYVDPVVDIGELRARVAKHGFRFDQWHASRFVEQYEGVRPDVFKKVKLLSGLRVVVICNFDNGLASVYHPPQLPGAKMYKVDTNLRMVANFVSEGSFPVKKNKGRHFIGRDALYTGADIAVAPKHDGVHAQFTLRENMASVVTNLGSFQLMLGCKVEGVHYLEGELMIKNWHKVDLTSNPVVKFFNYVSSNMYDIVIFDGVISGGVNTASFIDRWAAICQFFTVHNFLFKLFSLQNYLFHPSAEQVEDIYRGSPEGIVIQPVSSPAGAFGDGFGSARYVKKKVTYEDFRGATNDIWEFDLSGNAIRKRPDRVVPSTVAELALIREYWLFDEFIIYYRAIRAVMKGESSHRLPVFRSASEYVMALQGQYIGSDINDIITDVFLAYMDYYSNCGVITGAVQNVATLVKTVEQVRNKVVHSLDFLKFVGNRTTEAENFQAILAAKSHLTPGCTTCELAAAKCKRVTVTLKKEDGTASLDEYLNSNVAKYHRYVVFEADALQEMLQRGARTYPNHWFMMKGDYMRHGLMMHHIRPLGEIKKMVKVGDLPPQEMAFFHNIEFYEVEIDFHKRGAQYVGGPERVSFITVNILMDTRKSVNSQRPWMVPLLPWHSIKLRPVRCLSDMLRAFVRSAGLEMVLGL